MSDHADGDVIITHPILKDRSGNSVIEVTAGVSGVIQLINTPPSYNKPPVTNSAPSGNTTISDSDYQT